MDFSKDFKEFVLKELEEKLRSAEMERRRWPIHNVLEQECRTFCVRGRKDSKKVDWNKIFLWIAIIILMMFSFVWTWVQWNECRELGFSVLYCIQHVG